MIRAWLHGREVGEAVRWALLDYGVETYSAASRVARFIKEQRGYRWVGIFERRADSFDLLTHEAAAEPVLTLDMLAEHPRTIVDQHRMWATITSDAGALLGAIDVTSEAPLGWSDRMYLDICARSLRSIYGL